MGKLLRESLENATVIDVNGYQYFVHPLTDGIPAIEPELLQEVAEEVQAMADLDVDRILTVEAMGIPLATALSLRTGLPIGVVRKRRYGLPGEQEIGQQTGYSKGSLFVNGLAKGDRVLIVDDVVSTGGTLAPLVHSLRGMGVNVKDVVVLIEKGAGRAQLERELDLRIKTLQRIDIEGGRVRLKG